MLEITEIHYADLLPGFGKTYRALNLMEKHLKQKEGYLLYVGPTHNLLSQVKKDMEARLKVSMPDLKYRKYLYHIDSKFSDLKVSDEVLARLTGNKFSDGVGLGQVPEGSILFVTHAAFIGLKHKFSTRAQTKVIFDEARKCSLDDGAYSIPKEAWTLLIDSYLSFDMESAIKGHAKVRFMSDTFNLNSFAKKALTSGAHRSVVAHLIRLLESSNTANLELYIHLGSSSKKTQWISLHTVLVPSLMFAGWKNVLLLSAFFESSQMYHMLYRHDITNDDAPDCQRKLRLVPYRFDAGRTEAMRQRYRSLRITYLFDEEFTFSKSMLSKGIMIRAADWDRKDFEQSFVEWEKERKTEKMVTLRKALRYAFRGKFEDLPGIKQVLNKLPLHKEHSQLTPLSYMAQQAERLSEAWYRKCKQGLKPLLISCNASGGSTMERNRHWVKEIAPVVDDAILIPFFCQGLNEYQTHHTIAFFAAINVKPIVKSLMKSLCPEYDPHMDYALDQAVQTAMRISVRDANCEVSPLVIVPSIKLAHELAKHMRQLPEVIAPQQIIPNFKFACIYQYNKVVYKGNVQKKKKRKSGSSKKRIKSPEQSRKHLEKYLASNKGKKAQAWQRYLAANSESHKTRLNLYKQRMTAKASNDSKLLMKIAKQLELLKPKLEEDKKRLKPKFLKSFVP